MRSKNTREFNIQNEKSLDMSTTKITNGPEKLKKMNKTDLKMSSSGISYCRGSIVKISQPNCPDCQSPFINLIESRYNPQ